MASANNTNIDLNCLTISELEAIAHDKMDKQTRDYYNEGADSGSTLRENLSAYNKYRIRPRVLRDVSVVDPSTSIFGHKNSVPFGVAPTAKPAFELRAIATCFRSPTRRSSRHRSGLEPQATP